MKIQKLAQLFLRRRSFPDNALAQRTGRFVRYFESFPYLDYFSYLLSCKYKDRIRKHLAHRYIRGKGIEIGAQGNPLSVNKKKAAVTYIDRLSVDQNSNQYNLNREQLVPVNVFAEADDLSMFQNESLDFVISNHLLEHISDPIAALIEWFRVLKNGGTLFLSIPNRFCNEYDFERKKPTIDHIIDDHNNVKHSNIKEPHWHEFLEVVEGIPASDPHFSELLEKNYRSSDNRIHMHVFDCDLMDEILKYIQENLKHAFIEIDHFSLKRSFEIIYVLRKTNSNEYKKNRSPIRNFIITALAVLIKKP